MQTAEFRPTEAQPPVPAALALAQLRDAAAKSTSDPDAAMGPIQTLFAATDPRIRGLARKVMAELVLSSANRRAATLLHEACRDLGFQPDTLVARTVDAARQIEDFARVYELCICAAEHRAVRRELTPALVSLFNAATTDVGHGAQRVNDPDSLRRMISVYQRVSPAARESLGITPAAPAQRRTRRDARLRMAHVVCQLVDGGHAPSRSIQTMLRFADTERFDHFLVVTESLAPHAEHTETHFRSDTSDRRAPGLIRYFEQELRVPVVRPQTLQSFIHSAADLHRQMEKLKIDVAFFHGSIALPTEWLLCDWGCAPWQADAGFGVPLHCPAVNLQFFELEETIPALSFQCRERDIPYAFKRSGADMSEVRGAEPYPRSELGLRDDQVALGVIGNHLCDRMGAAFCQTVGEVLRSRPHAVLFVVGPGDFARHAEWFGADLCGGAEPQVRFCGTVRTTARFTQTFDVHLNPFPSGGGFAVGDAMAAGKPVVAVCMGDSLYAAAGRTWLGEENLVEPATPEAYAAALLRLIDSAEERARLGAALRQRFDERFDARRWVHYMSELIWNVVHATQPLRGRIDEPREEASDSGAAEGS